MAADAADLQIAREFFELFKTPWEPVVPGRFYDAVLTTDPRPGIEAKVTIVYNATAAVAEGAQMVPASDGYLARSAGSMLPIYGTVATFSAHAASTHELVQRTRVDSRVVWHIGYNVFGEVRYLLTEGQPSQNAELPALELHIQLLRDILIASEVAFVEIPPRPYHFSLICCLTHDVDFFGIRNHKFDRTLIGFAMRASLGSLLDLVRGRRTIGEVWTNWCALCAVPFVFLGLASDFWQPLDDFAKVEEPRQSTFFVVPFSNRAGIAPDGQVDRGRAIRYQLDEIAPDLAKAAADGSEVGVHGVDAWRDIEAGRTERERLDCAVGVRSSGVRMHWLYFDREAPSKLEAAGYRYDSTWGYNDTVGYRAGTAQVFQFPGTTALLELPLSLMDSALLNSGRMGLSQADAFQRCRSIVASTVRFGGTLVVNWHERSLAPERLWNGAYQQLLDEIRRVGPVWFATGREAVDWYRWRRGIRFSTVTPGVVRIDATATHDIPVLVRLHRRHQLSGDENAYPFDGKQSLELSL